MSAARCRGGSASAARRTARSSSRRPSDGPAPAGSASGSTSALRAARCDRRRAVSGRRGGGTSDDGDVDRHRRLHGLRRQARGPGRGTPGPGAGPSGPAGHPPALGPHPETPRRWADGRVRVTRRGAARRARDAAGGARRASPHRHPRWRSALARGRSHRPRGERRRPHRRACARRRDPGERRGARCGRRSRGALSPGAGARDRRSGAAAALPGAGDDHVRRLPDGVKGTMYGDGMTITLDPARCYAAVRSRDRRFDGRFFAGVVTTGVYCRPVCPVRPAKPENVRWFACAAAAEAAGFRPCRRCRPEASPGTPAWSGTSAVVARALRLIAAGALDEGGVDGLADRLGLGARQLRRLFATHLGASPAEVARARRAHFARTLLDETDLPMAEVAFSAGFGSIRDFNHALRATFGRTPTALRRARGRRGPVATHGGVTVRLAFRPPLDWSGLLGFLAPRATPGVEAVADGVYRRTIAIGDGAGTIEVRAAAGEPHLLMRVRLARPERLPQVVARARPPLHPRAHP